MGILILHTIDGTCHTVMLQFERLLLSVVGSVQARRKGGEWGGGA